MKESPVLIHVWDVDPAEVAAATGRLEEMFGELVNDPGFVAARVMQSEDQTSMSVSARAGGPPPDARRSVFL